MGPGMAAQRSAEVAARGVMNRQSRQESVGYEAMRMPVGAARGQEAEHASQNREDAHPALGIVRRGFAAIDALRGANVALTGVLSAMNFSQGHIGLGLMWGGLSLLWVGLMVASDQKRRN